MSEKCPKCGKDSLEPLIIEAGDSLDDCGLQCQVCGCDYEVTFSDLWARLKAMMPLFQEARDALPAISQVSAKLHGLNLSLADRMDDVGKAERWAARQAAKETT